MTPGPERAVVILDGGLATELAARGHDLSDRLWSARLLIDEPRAIEDVHLAYFRAGARVATTASYQATVPGFAAAGLDRAAALDAIRRSVELADRAAHRYAAEIGVARATLLVAGSVGPYGAMLADGSEYRGDYDPGRDALRDVHAPRMEALLEAGADLLAIETIPTIRGPKCWWAWSASSARTHGSRFSAATVAPRLQANRSPRRLGSRLGRSSWRSASTAPRRAMWQRCSR